MLVDAVVTDAIGEKIRGFEVTNNAWPLPNLEELSDPQELYERKFKRMTVKKVDL
jgi:hypothetical protein